MEWAGFVTGAMSASRACQQNGYGGIVPTRLLSIRRSISCEYLSVRVWWHERL
jgi:hypothetical protein